MTTTSKRRHDVDEVRAWWMEHRSTFRALCRQFPKVPNSTLHRWKKKWEQEVAEEGRLALLDGGRPKPEEYMEKASLLLEKAGLVSEIAILARLMALRDEVRIDTAKVQAEKLVVDHIRKGRPVPKPERKPITRKAVQELVAKLPRDLVLDALRTVEAQEEAG